MILCVRCMDFASFHIFFLLRIGRHFCLGEEDSFALRLFNNNLCGINGLYNSVGSRGGDNLVYSFYLAISFQRLLRFFYLK